jgi:hypothetical protein
LNKEYNEESLEDKTAALTKINTSYDEDDEKSKSQDHFQKELDEVTKHIQLTIMQKLI